MMAVKFLVRMLTCWLVCFTGLVDSAHPSYIKCNGEEDNAENGGPILIYKNATWHECQNGRLVVDKCINFVNSSVSQCVPYETVFNKTAEYLSSPRIANMIKPLFTDNLTFVDCVLMKQKMAWALNKFHDKPDCTTGIERLNSSASASTLTEKLNDTEVEDNVDNYLCSLKRKVYYMDEEGWYSCKNGVFQLQKCIIKRDTDYHCVDKKKIENALQLSGTLDELQGDICTNFSQNAETIFPNYEEHLEPCQAETKDDEDADDQTQTSAIALDFSPVPYSGGRKMVSIMRQCKEEGKNIDDIWYQCNMPTKCVVNAHLSTCISFRSIEFMFSNYQRAKLRRSEAWDDEKFDEIKDSLEGEHETYESLKSMKDGDATLFEKLSNLVVEKDNAKKIVTISVNKKKTKVTPYTACKVIVDLAPFKEAYIDKRVRSC